MNHEQGPQQVQVDSNQLAAQLDAFVSNVTFVTGSLLEPVSDTFLGKYLARQSPATPPTLREGVVQVAMPTLGWYRVALSEGGGLRSCCLLAGDTSFGLLGARDTSMLTPGTRVLLSLPPSSRTGYIIGSIPPRVSDGNFSFSDWVGQGSNVGSRRDGHHKQYLTLLSDHGGVENYSNHRPVDQTLLDWGRAAETGVWLHVDPQLAFLRASEMCGVFCFYVEQATRLAGQRLDILSAAHTEEYRNDEGELTYYRGESPYTWEMMGAGSPGEEVHRDVADDEVLNKKPLGKLEPRHDDQMPRYRYEEYGGYLGQARIRQVSVYTEDQQSVLRLSGETAPEGLFREAVCLDGEYLMQSAKGITLAKRAAIPIPKRKKLQEDRGTAADGGENGQAQYRFAGQYGNGVEHKVGDLTSDEEDHKHLLSVAAILDVHAYKFNWKSTHAFHYHDKDFLLPEEDDTKAGKLQERPDFSKLASDFWLPPPTPVKVKVDERYGEVDIYKLLSFISLTEDGAIVITAGNGETITLGHGNVMIDSPGGIFLRSGKSIVQLAGDDAVIRAYNSVDVTAAHKDVRIKGENNTQLLAGNSGKGSLLLECRSQGNSQSYPQSGGEDCEGAGIVLKSANSRAAVLAAGIYLRTGENRGGVSSGPIVLDANKGQEDVIVVANSARTYVNGSVIDTFGVEQARAVNQYQQGQTLLNGQLLVDTQLLVRQAVVVGGNVTAKQHFTSRQGGDVGRLQDTSIIDSQLAEVGQRQSQAKQTAGAFYRDGVDLAFRGAGQIGNPQVEQQVSFSCRSEEQYSTSQFVMPQPYWNQLAGDDTDGLKTWDEPVVKYQATGGSGGTETFPFPGKKKWADEDSLLVLPADELKLYDAQAGHDIARGTGNESAYAEKKLGKFEKKKPAEAYFIIDTG